METTANSQPSSFVQFLQNVKRVRTHRRLGGVCAGLAAYSDIPAWFFRAMFITFSILYIGVFGYVALWALMPVEPEGIKAANTNDATGAGTT